jgi:nucleoside-diphosphate-sugar epimerase
MLISGRARQFEVAGVRAESHTWNLAEVERFAPTVVVDCAFLTRDLVSDMSLEEYVDRNRALTATMLAASNLTSVGRTITISSGAAVYPHDALAGPLSENPYGYLKREAEEALLELSQRRGTHAVVARAWSVSGAFVQKPRSYALSDMILQARAGSIAISAQRLVYRRYASVEDLLAVALANAVRGGSPLIDSGGPLVEMSDLADAVRKVVNPSAAVSREELSGDAPNLYYATSSQWDRECTRLGFVEADLPAQIQVAHNGIPA